MKYLLKILLKLAVFLALLFSAAYAAAPYLIESLLLRQLMQRGFENVSIQAERPYWNALQLNWLSMESRQGAVNWLIEARHARVDINPLDFISGDLPVLSVSRLYLEIDSQNPRSNARESDFALQFPADWVALIPLRSLFVEQLSVDWRSQKNRAEYEGNVSLNRIVDRAEAEINLAKKGNGEAITYNAVLRMRRSGHIDLSLSSDDDKESPLLTLTSRLEERNETIEINKAELVFDAARLNELGRDLQLFEPVQLDMSGSVSANFSGRASKQIISSLPKQYRLSGEVHVKADSVVTPFYAYEATADVYADFDVDQDSSAFGLSERSRIETVLPAELIEFSRSPPWVSPLAAKTPLVMQVSKRLRFRSDLAVEKLHQLRQWIFDGELLFSVPLQSEKAWRLAFVSPRVDVSDVITLNSAYRLKAPFDRFVFDTGSLGRSELNAKGVLNIRGDQVNVSLSEGASWAFTEVNHGEQRLADVALRVSRQLDFNYDIAQSRWLLNNAQFAITAGPLQLAEYSLIPQSTTIDVKQALGVAGQWRLNGLLNTELVASHPSAPRPVIVFASAEFHANPDEITGISRLVVNDERFNTARGEFAYDWEVGTGGMGWRATAVPVANWAALLPVLAPAIEPGELTLNDGALDGEFSLLLRGADTRAKASIRLTGLNGTYGTLKANGLSARIVVDDLFTFTSKRKSSVTFEQIDVGLPLNNLYFDVLPVPNEAGAIGLAISNASARLLGGSIKLQDMVWRPDQEVEFAVDVEGFELKEILALERQPGLTGSGIIDGSIPVMLSNGAITVVGGSLQSRHPGGMLIYRRDDVAELVKANPKLGVALKALEGFHYDTLSATVNYQPSGDMLLALSISGHNPDFENGHQVNLNINVEENVKTLLKSLQLAEDITGKIEKRVQEGLKRNVNN